MAEIITNVLRTRAMQLGAAFFFAAVLVTTVDVKSLIVANEPVIPTQTFPPPIHVTTMKPSSTPMWSADPVKIPTYKPTPSLLETTAVKSVYMFQNALEQAKVELPGPKAYAKPPQRPLKTVSPAESSPDTFSSYQSGMNKSSPTAENSNGSFFKSIQDVLSGVKGHVLGVLVEVKEHVFASFAGMALPFGMVAWYQFRYLDHLRGKTIAQRLRSMVPRVVSRIAAQEGLIKELGKAVDRLEEVANLAMSMVVEERKAHKATVDDLKRQRATDADTILGLTEKVQSIIQKHEATATQAGKHLEAAEEKASQAEEKLAEAATLAETSEQKILQLESKKSSLTDSLIKSSNALAEAVSNAKKAGEDAKKTEKALQEQVAELIKQHNENAAQSTARNTKLQDELDREKEARLGLISNDESPRVKDAEEGQQRAEEAARRAKGEAAHLVRSQAGQLNRAKAMNDAYRARYGKLDEDKTVDTSTATASSANATSSTPSKNQVRNDGDSTKEASGGSSQGSTEVVSSHSATASNDQPQAVDGTADASSATDGDPGTCPNPRSSLIPIPGNKGGQGHKKPHRRGARPRQSKDTSQTGEGLPANTPTGPKAQRESKTGDGASGS